MNADQAKADAKKAADDAAHSAAADKAKGHTKQLIGNIQQTIGDFIGNDELMVKGAAQRADGKKDELKGDIKEKIDDIRDTLKAGVSLAKEKLHETRRSN